MSGRKNDDIVNLVKLLNEVNEYYRRINPSLFSLENRIPFCSTFFSKIAILTLKDILLTALLFKLRSNVIILCQEIPVILLRCLL